MDARVGPAACAGEVLRWMSLLWQHELPLFALRAGYCHVVEIA